MGDFFARTLSLKKCGGAKLGSRTLTKYAEKVNTVLNSKKLCKRATVKSIRWTITPPRGYRFVFADELLRSTGFLRAAARTIGKYDLAQVVNGFVRGFNSRVTIDCGREQ